MGWGEAPTDWSDQLVRWGIVSRKLEGCIFYFIKYNLSHRPGVFNSDFIKYNLSHRPDVFNSDFPDCFCTRLGSLDANRILWKVIAKI